MAPLAAVCRWEYRDSSAMSTPCAASTSRRHSCSPFPCCDWQRSAADPAACQSGLLSDPSARWAGGLLSLRDGRPGSCELVRSLHAALFGATRGV